LNYMTVRSRGAALWIGLNMHKASVSLSLAGHASCQRKGLVCLLTCLSVCVLFPQVKLSKDDLRRCINGTSFHLGDFLSKLRKVGLHPSMQLQTPGTCIYSPNGTGSAHIVITVGAWVEQIAINYSMSPVHTQEKSQGGEHVRVAGGGD